MLKVTAVVEAEPEIVLAGLLAGITCLRSKNAVELAASEVAEAIATPSMLRVKVEVDVAVLATTMLVTIAVAEVEDTV